MIKKFLGIALVLVQGLSFASDRCFESSAKAYNIDANLIRAIAWQESNFRIDAKNVNKNGSTDLGVMQINGIHYDRLSAMGIQQSDLASNGCLNVFVGTFILAEIFKKHGMNWNSVGIYNAGPGTKKITTIKNRVIYASKINEKLRAVRAARMPSIQQPTGWLPLSMAHAPSEK
ncbi:lytic transglycosylase domain-containing protein [Pseudomonas sp. P5_152]|uniref:lytic transglycosylase domain-containing protein n=1 Tax=Pseudomonas sp. P5_152 TaxID=3043442 RepID=UPI002A36EE34|nr:lytic transglycosylase domain-containing protein [Pseudomonas sp. P5_152]MDX9668631.1 lytic transglycosylase domain-containing protein [Pseudomonas sp. P5_152]